MLETYICTGSDNDQVSLKLHNDGFAYTSKPGRRITRHISNKGQQHGKQPSYKLAIQSILC